MFQPSILLSLYHKSTGAFYISYFRVYCREIIFPFLLPNYLINFSSWTRNVKSASLKGGLCFYFQRILSCLASIFRRYYLAMTPCLGGYCLALPPFPGYTVYDLPRFSETCLHFQEILYLICLGFQRLASIFRGYYLNLPPFSEEADIPCLLFQMYCIQFAMVFRGTPRFSGYNTLPCLGRSLIALP